VAVLKIYMYAGKPLGHWDSFTSFASKLYSIRNYVRSQDTG